MNQMFGVYLVSINRFNASITKPIEPTTLNKSAEIDTFSIFSASLLLLFFNLEYVLKINAIKQIRNTVAAMFLFLKCNLDFLVRFLGIVKFPKHQIRVNRKIRDIKLKKSSIIRNSQSWLTREIYPKLMLRMMELIEASLINLILIIYNYCLNKRYKNACENVWFHHLSKRRDINWDCPNRSLFDFN